MHAKTWDQGSINRENGCTAFTLNNEYHWIKGPTSPWNTKEPSNKHISNCMSPRSPYNKR